MLITTEHRTYKVNWREFGWCDAAVVIRIQTRFLGIFKRWKIVYESCQNHDDSSTLYHDVDFNSPQWFEEWFIYSVKRYEKREKQWGRLPSKSVTELNRKRETT